MTWCWRTSYLQNLVYHREPIRDRIGSDLDQDRSDTILNIFKTVQIRESVVEKRKANILGKNQKQKQKKKKKKKTHSWGSFHKFQFYSPPPPPPCLLNVHPWFLTLIRGKAKVKGEITLKGASITSAETSVNQRFCISIASSMFTRVYYMTCSSRVGHLATGGWKRWNRKSSTTLLQ